MVNGNGNTPARKKQQNRTSTHIPKNTFSPDVQRFPIIIKKDQIIKPRQMQRVIESPSQVITSINNLELAKGGGNSNSGGTMVAPPKMSNPIIAKALE